MLNYWGLSSVTTSKQLYFSLLLSFLCFVSKEESSTGFLRTLVTWTLCFHGRLWTSPRWVSPRQVWWLALQHREAISCLAKPALWSGSPNLETITVGLPASAAQCLHRFNKSVHIDWGRGSPSVTQQKSSENMYGDLKYLGGRRALKKNQSHTMVENSQKDATRAMCCKAERKSSWSSMWMCLMGQVLERGMGMGQFEQNQRRTFPSVSLPQ